MLRDTDGEIQKYLFSIGFIDMLKSWSHIKHNCPPKNIEIPVVLLTSVDVRLDQNKKLLILAYTCDML